MAVDPAVEFDGAVHWYRSGVAVGPLTIRVDRGEVVALVGHNGSGKTTALRMALGLAPIHRGVVQVHGAPVVLGRLPADCTGMIEKPSFLNALTGAQNLELFANGERDRTRRIGETLALVGLGGIRKRVSDYSLGMKQRLAVARVLLPDAAVLLLDEPANGLDPAGVKWFHELIRDLADNGRAILIASHQVHELAAVTDRIVSMDDHLGAGRNHRLTGRETTGPPDKPATIR